MESWLNERNDIALELPGYKSTSLYRSRKGGGIKVYYMHHLNMNLDEMYTNCNRDFESLVLKTNVPGLGLLNIASIYRPPTGNFSEFKAYLEDLLNHVGSQQTIITGDFNFDIATESWTAQTTDYYELMTCFGYRNCIDKKTYVNPSSSIDTSCLDHLWFNFNKFSSSFVVKPNISDHYPICATFETNASLIPIKTMFRDFSRENFRKLNQNLEEEFSRYAPYQGCVETDITYLNEFLVKLQDKYFPIKTKTLTVKRMNSPWITSDIIKCIQKKHDWHKLLRQNRITACSYNTYCKKLRNLLRIAEEEYYAYKLKSLGKDHKKSWNTLNNLLNRTRKGTQTHFELDGTHTTDKKTISREFLKHFVNKPKYIHSAINDSTNDYLALVPLNPSSIMLNPSTSTEVAGIIKQLNKEGGLFDIKKCFLLAILPLISSVLSELFNRCVETGIFPDSLKTARVTPIYKKGSKTDIKNYRPVSVLGNISKIFEGLMFNRISDFFYKNELLCETQYGFRKKKNTELANLDLVQKILPTIEEKSFAVCVFLDFTACFDTIDRSLLLKKIERYGVRGIALSLVSSYFDGRKQFVMYNSEASETVAQNIGVIQGSKCGPLFYDIYSNDMNHLLHRNDKIYYADDTCLVFRGHNLDALTAEINSTLRKVFDWCNFNKVALNPSKSVYMLVTGKLQYNEPRLSIDGDEVKRVETFCYLGLNIDEGMKYNSQVEFLRKKFSQLAGMTYRIRKHLDRASAKKLYYAFVYSIMTYCIVAWGGAMLETCSCSSIVASHKRIVKNLFGRFHLDSECIFKSTKILKLPDVYRLKVAIYMFKILKYRMFKSVADSLSLKLPSHRYPTSTRSNFVLPFPRTNAIKINYKYQFIKIWNSIPLRIVELNELSAFKKEYTNYIFCDY